MTDHSKHYPLAPRLVGTRAYVSAAAQGIGGAVARRLAAEGADVLASDINGDKLAELASSAIQTIVLDSRDEAAVAKALRAFGPLDAVVNCVGWVQHGTVLDGTVEDWSRSFALNVDTAFHAIRAALPSMLERRWGSIVNIASAASSIKGFPNRAAYGASKAALIGLTKAIAVDFAHSRVRCNAICPGTVESPSLLGRIDAFADPVAARSAFIARQPIGRFGTPEEIAAFAAYLCADESAFMTGSITVLDGGATA